MIFRKYNLSNNLIFDLNIGRGFQRQITTDTTGNIYMTGDLRDNRTTRKFNSSGVLQWSVSYGSDTKALAVDLNNNVYVVGNRSNINITTRKYNSNGNLVWSIDYGGSQLIGPNAVEVDSLGNVYVGGPGDTGGLEITTRKYDTDGNLIWERDGIVSVRSLAVDKEGNVYTANKVSTGDIRKYNVNGDLIWTFDPSNFVGGSTADFRSIDTFPPNKGAFLS
jgi:sugar lactone lactonase YvrE